MCQRMVPRGTTEQGESPHVRVYISDAMPGWILSKDPPLSVQDRRGIHLLYLDNQLTEYVRT